MIVKMDKSCITTDFKSAIGYHEKKVKEGVAVQISSTHPFSRSIQSKAKPFENVSELNSRLKVKGLDVPFSFDKSDKINDDIFLELFKQYQKDFNFNNRPFIIYKHEDTDNLHYHAILSNCDYQGNVNPVLSTFYRRDVTLWSREKEKEFGFKQLNEIGEGRSKNLSEINLDKYSYSRAILKAKKDDFFPNLNSKQFINKSNYQVKKILGKDFTSVVSSLFDNDYLKENIKTKLIKELDLIKSNISSNNFSLTAYFNEVNASGLYVKELKRTTPRKLTYGIKNDKGTFTYFGSDKLPKRFGYKELLNNKSTNFSLDKQKSYLKNMINKSFKNSRNYDDFKLSLKKNGVGVEELKNDSFGIYGLKYYSLNVSDPFYFSASEIDRKFSFNTMNKYWDSLAVEIKTDEVINNLDKASEKEKGRGKTLSSVSSNAKSEKYNKREEGDVTQKAKVGNIDDDKKKKGRGM